jgi:hypothetical protein
MPRKSGRLDSGIRYSIYIIIILTLEVDGSLGLDGSLVNYVKRH